jgi:hypothetical protein
MGWNCSIRLISESGRPVTNCKVLINFSGLIGTSHSETTDGDGWANFENEYEDEDRSRSVDAIAAYIGLFGGTEIELQTGGSIDDGESLSFTITDEDFNDASDLP